ncbi:MAG: diguanylate cyclase [Arcobacteraceae bacterium]|nr:diguanylate cyclase [Arcobacteraceae bacterium]
MLEHEKIKWKYLIVLFIIFSVTFIGRVYFDNQHYKMMLDSNINQMTSDIQKSFNTSKVNLKDKYLMVTNHFGSDEYVSNLFKNDKREALYQVLKNDYASFKQIDPHLYVMHFIDNKNITVLRMHKPNSFDDDLTKKRPIVAFVNKSLENQYAFEVGKNGIVYRVTIPYIYKNKHIGVLEFGIKPSYFVDLLNKQFEVQSEILVKTKALKTLEAYKKYKQIDKYSIITSNPFFHKLTSMIDLTKNYQIIKMNGKTYIVLTDLNLENFQNEDIAKVIVAKDITKFIEENNSSLLLVNSLTFIIFLLILTILYIIFTKYSDDLKQILTQVDFLHKKSIHLQDKANTDHLTKTYNKAYFDKYLNKFLDIKANGIIIFFDIDHFKKINDTYGHLVGDEILIKLSDDIKHFLREDDIFVRWGGEEFIVLIEDISYKLAIKKANSLRLLVEKIEFTQNIPVTISLGVTMIKDDDSKETLLKRADKLLYKAKHGGRNCVKCD